MFDLVLLSVFPAAMALAAASDLFSMTISNRICVGLAAVFFVVALLSGMDATTVLVHLSTGVAMLVLGFGLFAMGWIGGGDAKLFAATALWLGWGHMLEYSLWASLIGGLLTMGLLSIRAVPLPESLAGTAWASRLHNAGHGVPYGIALAVAGLIVYPSIPLFGLIIG